MLKTILIGLAVVVVIFAAVVAMQPDDFSVTRSATMSAPPAAIFAQVNDLHKWEAWSPWAKLDPNAKSSYAGAPEGVGASMSWAGNMQVGEGTMTITKSQPSESIEFKLDFLKPMEGTNIAEFTFKPEGNQTNVTWTMSGKRNFIAKAMGLIFNCEKMVGEQFEKGLGNLKAIVETK